MFGTASRPISFKPCIPTAADSPTAGPGLRHRMTQFNGLAAEQPQQGFQHAAQHFENIVDGRHHDWNQPRLSVNFLTARMISASIGSRRASRRAEQLKQSLSRHIVSRILTLGSACAIRARRYSSPIHGRAMCQTPSTPFPLVSPGLLSLRDE
jgi:hypothetical protein